MNPLVTDEDVGYDVEANAKPDENPLEGLTDAEQTVMEIFGAKLPSSWEDPITAEEKARLVERYGQARVKYWFWRAWSKHRHHSIRALRALANDHEGSIGWTSEARDVYEERWTRHDERKARHGDKRPFHRVIERLGGIPMPSRPAPIGPREWVKAQVMAIIMGRRRTFRMDVNGVAAFDEDMIIKIDSMTDEVMARFSSGNFEGISEMVISEAISTLQSLGFGAKMPWLSVRENIGAIDDGMIASLFSGTVSSLAKGRCSAPAAFSLSGGAV